MATYYTVNTIASGVSLQMDAISSLEAPASLHPSGGRLNELMDADQVEVSMIA